MLLQQDSCATPRYGPYSKAYPTKAQRIKPRFHMSAVSWLLLLAAAVLAAASAGRMLLPRHRTSPVLYALVIDSGSSGTRIYAYNWTTQPSSSRAARSSSSSSSNPFPVVKPIPPSAAAHLIPKHTSKGMYNRVETRPGLDAFAAAPAAGLTGALGPLLAWARAVVPAGQQSSTPLYFMATGGLRRLPVQQQEALLAEVRKQLGQSGFRFEPSWARVISGDDEGAFGWLALNYQQGRLRPHQPAAAAAAGSTAASSNITSLGALDLGGSSLQVTFEVPHALSSSSSDKHGSGTTTAAAAPPATAAVGPLPECNISVAGHTFQLHLHSFKQYGLNEAYDRSITLLLQQQETQALQMFLRQQGQHEVLLQQPAGGSSNGTSDEATVLVPSASADTSSNASSDGTTRSEHLPSGAAAGAIQHDIAVARAAGVDADPYVVTTDGTAEIQLAPQHLEQQRQADLAVAAAAGFHPHEAPAQVQPDSTGVSSSTAQVQDDLGSSSSVSSSGTLTSTSSSSAAVDSSSVVEGSSSHGGLQPGAASTNVVQTPSSAVQADSSGAVQTSYAVQADGSGGPTSPGLRLQAGTSPLLPAARRRASGLVRRSLLQQQLVWLEQRLGAPAAQRGQSLPVSSHGGSAGDGAAAGASGASRLGQHSHDVVLRQLLRDYLLRGDPAVAAPAAAAVGINSSSSAGGADVVLSPAAVAEAHPVVPVDVGSISSSSSSIVSKPAPMAVQEERPGISATTSSSSSSSTSQLPVVRHPCLHEGYEAVYTRVAYAGFVPDPPQVLLHGAPDWESCLAVVNAVVNASAPCAVHAHLPACVLGTPQPELQGNFMALTGFYVVSRFLEVQDSHSLQPLLDAAKTLCRRPWPWVQKHLGSNVNVERYCTWGPYVVQLLLHGLGLEESKVAIAKDGDLGWPLGAVLVEASRLPGFSTAAAGTGTHTAPSSGGRKGRHRKRGRKRDSSMRGSAAVLQGNAQDAAGASSGTPGVQGASSDASTAPAVQAHTAGTQPPGLQARSAQGPHWSLGLLHHNQSDAGLHLSGPGWVVVLGVVWVVLVGWCRGVCGPATVGPVSFLPLTGLLSSTAGPGRAHSSGYATNPRAKVSPIRGGFKVSN